jgi:hypothetical protein
MVRMRVRRSQTPLVPAEAGTQGLFKKLDSRLRGNERSALRRRDKQTQRDTIGITLTATSIVCSPEPNTTPPIGATSE